MLQPPALEKFFKFPLHIARQFLSLLCHKRSECRVILVNDLIEKGLLGSVALVTTSIPIPAGRPGRHMRHVPRPCNTVFTYSLSLRGKFFYPQPKCLPLLDIARQCPSLTLYCKQDIFIFYIQWLIFLLFGYKIINIIIIQGFT